MVEAGQEIGGMPPTHLHPRQAERFEVIEGAMRAVIGDEERVFEVGEIFEVPVGTPHQMGAERPTRMRWEVRPALRTAEFALQHFLSPQYP
jgi:mannose-6-phosphate isomerase-like protein (cupin superfamily)